MGSIRRRIDGTNGCGRQDMGGQTGILKGKQNPCFVRATSTTAGEHDGDPAFKILPKLGRIIRQTVAKNRALAFQQEVDLIFEFATNKSVS